MEVARDWASRSPWSATEDTATADFLVCGVRGSWPGAYRSPSGGAELEVGWLADGTLVAVSGRLHWDDEPRSCLRATCACSVMLGAPAIFLAVDALTTSTQVTSTLVLWIRSSARRRSPWPC